MVDRLLEIARISRSNFVNGDFEIVDFEAPEGAGADAAGVTCIGARTHGPVGKTERCLLVVVAAASGWAVPVLTVIAAGSLLTAGLRLAGLWRETA
ncbi:hypothetical protein AB0I93_26275 [Streptomyces sp. NPDC049967]|uniref:hypothetical protein n=1 Tax=Streptomyces sp. NPDC049967 TaxID=3155658 RepID=UPI003427DC7B